MNFAKKFNRNHIRQRNLSEQMFNDDSGVKTSLSLNNPQT